MIQSNSTPSWQAESTPSWETGLYDDNVTFHLDPSLMLKDFGIQGEILETTMRVVYVIIAVNIFISNSLTIIAVKKFKNLHTSSNILIFSLSCADLIVAFPVGTIRYYKLMSSVIAIKLCYIIASSLLMLSIIMSLITSFMIAIDRFIAVVHPLKYKVWVTTERTKLVISVTWAVSTFITFPILGYYTSRTSVVVLMHTNLIITLLPSWALYYYFIQIFLCTTLSIFIYLRIFWRLHKRNMQVGALQAHPPGQQVSSHARHTTYTMAIVLFVLILSWVPFLIFSFTVKRKDYQENFWPRIVSTVFNMIIYSNSFVNVLIYAYRSKSYRNAYKHLLRCSVNNADPASGTSQQNGAAPA